jgi:hypothetical protein
MAVKELIIGGITLPVRSRYEMNQTYDNIGGTSSFRTLNGRLVKQTHWESLRTSISGAGAVPHPFHFIDRSVPQTLDCVAPMSSITADLVFTIPRPIRPDVEPIVHGIDGFNLVLAESVTVGNVVTTTALPGITEYVIEYYPRMTVFILDLADDSDANERDLSWALTCEETT